MADTALFELADLAVLLDVPTDTMPTDRALLARTLATGLVQGHLGQNVFYVEDDRYAVRPDQLSRDTFGRLVLPLPERPVAAVASVSGATSWLRDGNDIVVMAVAAPLWPLTGMPSAEIVVTYSHGFVTIPGDIKDVALAIAALRYDNPGSVQADAEDDYRRQYAPDPVAAHLRRLNHYRPRR